MKLKYLVTGTGRSGSVFAAKLLTSVGVPCGHETFFDVRGLDYAIDRLQGKKRYGLSWVSTMEMNPNGEWDAVKEWVDIPSITSESSYFAAPYLDHEILSETKFIHLVRHPVRVVNSFVNSLDYFSFKSPANKVYENNICEFLPEISENMTQIERACLYYVRWNEMIENKLKGKEYLFHPVEEDPQPILDFVNAKCTGTIHSDTETNSMKRRGEKLFQINQLPEGSIKKEFIDIGERYGYQMGSDYLIV